MLEIPITFTKMGNLTAQLIKNLVNEKIKLNITAIFTFEQIKEIFDIVKDTNTILSIFLEEFMISGKMQEKFLKRYPNMFVLIQIVKLWASCRMPYDIIDATDCNAHINTMGPDMVKKLTKFNKLLKNIHLKL